MEHITKQLKKGAEHVRLSSDEKAAMKHALLSHVKANPVRIEATERHTSREAHGIPSPISINHLRNKKTMPIFAIIALLMSGSVSFAAENTVPGDALYPVKVHVNENVRSAIAVSPKAQAEWDVQLVERRLQEVEKLATQDTVAPAVQQEAKDNLQKYTERAKGDIKDFEDKNDGEDAVLTAGQLSDILRSYADILANLDTNAQVAASATASSTTPVATSTATTTVDATATTTTAVAAGLTKETLKDILEMLEEDHKDVKEHHNELKHKFHVEDNAEHTSVVSTATVGATTTSSVNANTTAVDATNTTTNTTETETSSNHESTSSKRDSNKSDTHKSEIRQSEQADTHTQTSVNASVNTPVLNVGASLTGESHTESNTKQERSTKSDKNND